MVQVIAWPPVAAVAYELAHEQPISRSASVLTGRRYVSAPWAMRRSVALQVSGAANMAEASGYVEMLKRQLRGGVNLVRIDLSAPGWWSVARGLGLRRGKHDLWFSTGDEALNVTQGGVQVRGRVGAAVSGVAGTRAGWPILTCTGLPVSQAVAWPAEVVQVRDAERVDHTARVLRLAKSDAAGEAVIVLDAALPDGEVLIGFRESAVFEVLDPDGVRAVAAVGGDWVYKFDLREVFESEVDGFVEVDPWR